ncbi:MAG: GyrI-like domain-containing protein [Thermoplasmatota archaeon]
MGEIEIIEVESIKVIGIRKTGGYHEIPNLFMSLVHHAMANNIQLKGPAIFVSHERSEEEAMKAMAENNADLEAAFPIAGDIAPETDEIKCYELPGGTVAKMVHKGPYDSMGPAYSRLFAWMAENGKELKGDLRELYWNSPREVPPEELLTEIHAPIG